MPADHWPRSFSAAHEAGKIALANTPEQLPVLKEAGVVDAGGAGFLLLLDSALHIVDGVPLPEAEEDDGSGGAVAAAFETTSPRLGATTVGGAGDVDVADQRYEVMYFLDLDDARIDEFKAGWGALSATRSSSSAATASGTAMSTPTTSVPPSRCHSDLGGRPKQIRVTDLFEEVEEEHAKREGRCVALRPRCRRQRPCRCRPTCCDNRSCRGLLGRRPRRVVCPARGCKVLSPAARR